RALAEQAQDLSPRRIGERLEGRVTHANIIIYAYAEKIKSALPSYDVWSAQAQGRSRLGIRARNQAAQIHRKVTVSHATREAFRLNVFVAPATDEGTMSFALFTAECSTITSSRLPRVRA